MIIEPDSALHRVPRHMSSKQAAFVDGIRLTIQIIDLAHRRLQLELQRITPVSNEPQTEKQAFADAMIDAWSIVDAGHRLNRLFVKAPGIRHKQSPSVRKLLSFDKALNQLRNSIQHLEGDLQRSVTRQSPVWGSLAWCILHPETNEFRSCVLIPGRAATGSHPMLNPLGRTLNYPVDMITMTLGPTSVSLSELVATVEASTRGLEKALEEAVKDQLPDTSTYGADLLVSITFAGPEGAPASLPRDISPEHRS